MLDELKKRLSEFQSAFLPPVSEGECAEYDFNPDPLASVPFLEFAGRMPHKKSADISGSPLGIGFETLDRRTFEPSKTFPWLAESGVKHARCQTGWMRCETVPGQFDFGWLDEVVDGLASIGIRTWFSLSYGNPLYTPNREYAVAWEEARKTGKTVPGWARGYVAETPFYHGEESMTAWRRYVAALTTHFGGRVSEWEVWNEPEAFWLRNNRNVAVTEGIPKAARDYVEFVRDTASVVRSVLPDARIIADVAQTGTTYIRELGKNRLGEVIDVFSYHFYGNNPEDFLPERVAHIRANLEIPGKKLEVWEGESGRASGKSALFAMPSEYNQAKYLVRRHVSDIACGCSLTSFFTATDLLCYYPDGGDSHYGIIHARENRPKLAYFAMQSLGWLFDGLETAPEYFCAFTPLRKQQFCSVLPFSVKTLSLRRKGIPVFALWLPENVEISAQTVPGMIQVVTEDAPLLREPIFIDPIRRNVYGFRDGNPRRNMNFGSFIGAQEFGPISLPDYPVFISDASLFSGN
ncbi:MAG: hypothetical protein BWY31_02718 [Lentisphaerae bacterium ADurb.Bin242]|nr:MAG: hypothetical protein BWY31_02718 [Lentisphaerae bacterium ADurb.Bin242]